MRTALAGLAPSLLTLGALALTVTIAPADSQGEETPPRDELGRELRALFAAEPDLITDALHRAEAARIAAAEAPLAAEIREDRARIAVLSERLFAAAPLGFGAADPEARVTLFTAAGCAACQRAERALRAMAERLPDLRVDLRPARDTLADRLSLEIAAEHGTETALTFRAAIPEGRAGDAVVLARVMAGLGLPETLMQNVRNAAEHAEIAEFTLIMSTLNLDVLPSYVLPDMMFRGEMPDIVLARYLGTAPE
ncbi:hypothetical protein [Pseudooceanicola aestuarii]|uniref:hypothetical protein n=1 Tax=Pseudooceanicola aestuarii TaxID=2697319 RepID=UPI0013D3D8F4|nr:hypothetical protein [Pseudooceanicola aestuarii]